MTTNKPTIYDQVTGRLLEMMREGVRPWAQSWKGSAAPLGIPLNHAGAPYRGINILILWSAQVQRGFTGQRWVTYKRAQELGGQVKRGAKSETIVFWERRTEEVEKANGDVEEVQRWRLFTHRVFNVDETEGLPADMLPDQAEAEAEAEDPAARIDCAEAFLAGTRADIRHGGGSAFYRPRPGDYVQMPPFGAFPDPLDYYATALHELVHWSGDLGRTGRHKRMSEDGWKGRREYAFEELCAELGAAFLMAELGISAEPREDHASYLAGWIKALENDNRFIFDAARFAQTATDYLHKLQPAAAAEADQVAAE